MHRSRATECKIRIGIVEPEAKRVAEFIETVNNWFDIMNSYVYRKSFCVNKQPHTAADYQVKN